MSEIISNKLFLGDMFDANNSRELKEKGITCIICVANNLEIRLENENINLYKYDLEDSQDCNISLHFDEIGSIIERETRVLVNCAAGISRSSTIVISYLMKYHNLNLREAIIAVRFRRSIICPNKNFLRQLFEYEKTLFGVNYFTWDEIVKLNFYS